MDVPFIYQQYPTVPLEELSDLYSAGTNTLDGRNVCIVSYLPKTLCIHEDFPFNNTYLLFIQNTATVTSVSWRYRLYNKGAYINDTTFLEVSGASTNRYSVTFSNSLFDSSGGFLFDKLKIICEVRGGGDPVTLEVEHNFAKMINVQQLTFQAPNQTPLFLGNPHVTNYLMNHLRSYFETPSIIWNGGFVEIDTSGQYTLQKIVMAIIHRNLVTADVSWLKPDNLFDSNEYTNAGLQAFLNDNTPYAGTYANGLCDLPLHIVNDVLGNNNQVPDFFNITKANNVYGMIVHEPPLVKSVSDEFLTPVSAKLAASKQRLIDNKVRFAELFNLSLFPKSAIKLTAILVKYLFECSKKNECKDCKFSFLPWHFLSLDGLKEHQDFLKNTLTHYYNGPANVIDDFATKAVQTVAHVWGPVPHTVLNIQPRILKAYFAKRVFKQVSPTEVVLDLERIDSNAIRVDDDELAIALQPAYDDALGRDVYLVVDTLHCRGKQLTINVHPAGNNITGNTNAIELMSGTNFATEFTPAVGNVDPLRDNNTILPGGADAEQNYEIDHKDRAIITLTLRPSTRALFDGWTNTLATNTGELQIKVRLPNNGAAYFGNAVTATAQEAMFLSATDPYDNSARFRVVNRIVYEIYHQNNPYKHRINAGATFADRIAKIENTFVRTIANGTAATPSRIVSYYYIDALGQEHFFGEFQIHRTQRWPVANTQPNDTVDMLNITPFTEYDRRKVHVAIRINNSPRDYVDIDRMAGLLGAMAANNIADLCFNGFSNQDGSAGASVSHINGVNGDLRYLRTDFSGGPCLLTDAQFDWDRQVDFNNSLEYYGWGRANRMLSERFTNNAGQQLLLPHCNHFHKIRINNVSYNSEDVNINVDFPQLVLEGPFANQQVNAGTVTRHNNHLHMQGFDVAVVQAVNTA